MFRLRWPTEYNIITQSFGANPQNYRPWGLPGHEGIDFAAPLNSKIFACADGVISEVRLEGHLPASEAPYGNQVRIRHEHADGTFITVYAHLVSVSVTVGQVVKRGDVIGLADSTGNSSGHHLHLTLKKVGATRAGETGYPNDIIDPTPYLDPFESPGEPTNIQVDKLGYERDVTYEDYSVVAPGKVIKKVWQVKNTGTTTWTDGYKFAFYKDEQMGAASPQRLPAAEPGDSVKIMVTLTAPQSPGLHRSTWRAQNAAGEFFGTTLFALIRVEVTGDEAPYNGILDLSHHNTITDWQAMQSDGVVAIIHKATQGTGFVDPQYASRKLEARRRGILWGAYHFGEGGDPRGQARHFLDTVQPDGQTVLALDFEGNPLGPDMDLAEAEEFVRVIHDETGTWPLLYTGNWYIQAFIGAGQMTLLSNCPLWIAVWVDEPTFPSQWGRWTIWQYTNGLAGPEPRDVAGVTRCDRDRFNGTLQNLRDFWAAEAP